MRMHSELVLHSMAEAHAVATALALVLTACASAVLRELLHSHTYTYE